MKIKKYKIVTLGLPQSFFFLYICSVLLVCLNCCVILFSSLVVINVIVVVVAIFNPIIQQMCVDSQILILATHRIAMQFYKLVTVYSVCVLCCLFTISSYVRPLIHHLDRVRQSSGVHRSQIESVQ